MQKDIKDSELQGETSPMPSIVLSYPESCLIDNLRKNGPSYDNRRRRISLEKINTKIENRRQSLPVLPSYLSKAKNAKSIRAKQRKGVTFPLGVLMQQAVTSGDLKEIKQLIADHGSKAVEEREPNGLPPVMRAIFEGQTDCLRLLIESGADVLAKDPENWNVLHVAAAMNNMEAAQLVLTTRTKHQGILQARNIDGEKPIDLVESIEMTRFLLHADLDEFRSSNSLRGGENGETSEQAVLQLTKDHCEKHSNCAALDNVLKTNTCYHSLLHLAATKNYPCLVDYICRHQLSSLEIRDRNGWTPLHTAAYYNCLEVVVLLMEQGANHHALTHSYEKPSDLTEHQLILELLEGDLFVESI